MNGEALRAKYGVPDGLWDGDTIVYTYPSREAQLAFHAANADNPQVTSVVVTEQAPFQNAVTINRPRKPHLSDLLEVVEV